MRKLCVLLILCGLYANMASASPSSVVDRHVPEAELVGKGRLSFFFWRVYDASLYAPEGIWKESKPYALEISYLREIEGEDIAVRSIAEMDNVGCLNKSKESSWLSEMRRIFPDVRNGSVLTGIRGSDGSTLFYLGGSKVGEVSDSEFGSCFFSIWLSADTSEPKLRRALLGG